MLSKY